MEKEKGKLMPLILQLLKLCVIGFVFSVQGSTGLDISPSPAILSVIPPVEGTPGNSLRSNAQSPASQPNGSNLYPPIIPPIASPPVPQMVSGLAPSLSPSTPVDLPPHSSAPPPIVFQGHEPSLPPVTPLISPPFTMATPPSFPPRIPAVSTPSSMAPPPLIVHGLVPSMLQSAPPGKAPVRKSPVSLPGAPVATPLRNSPQPSPLIPARTPGALPPIPHERNASNNKAPNAEPTGPVATPLRNSPQPSPLIPARTPGALPPITHERNASNNKAPTAEPTGPVPLPTRISRQKSPMVHPTIPRMTPSPLPVPVPSPTGKLPEISPAIHPVMPGESPSVLPDPDVPPPSAPPSGIDRKKGGVPVAEPPYEIPKPLQPVSHSPTKGYQAPASSPSASIHKHHHTRNKIVSPPSSYFISPTASIQQGPALPPVFVPISRRRHHASPPINPVYPSHSPSPSSVSHVPAAPPPSPVVASVQTGMPVFPPKVSPSGPSTKHPKVPVLPPIHTLPPPPPNEDCSATICTEPYTNTPPGSPCGCVWPMQVGLRLSVALYTFFPLVSELAAEIASGVFMKQSQVRIMGANAASQQPEKTVVLIDLVPLGEKFDNTTALLTYHRFWHKQILIKSSYFGDYEVLYVHYPGLPPSPPSASSDITIIDDGPYSGNNGRAIKPEGVNVPKRQKKHGLSGGTIAIVVLSAFVAVVLCSAVAWVLLSKYRGRDSQRVVAPQTLQSSHAKASGATGSTIGSGLDSASLSFGSSIATYTGSAKTFTANDIEKATCNFDSSKILGEGGFGRVYSGVLEDGTKVAVKVLKRDDQQGGREFLAEVEMLSRLHHRNLVKLIGICIEEHARCLVYELIPNGSVESHLHGVDKESAPLGWDARLKIALGSARGLAYLHEDSSPRVIHRDFKASNILLEHDFTPKVSDFGLARTALDEESRHISTRVMGTFGYVAPEYAMTGHLLVKSDVYSYGVVLLELLTGRKPVDMSQLPGQENLVAWARPLLTSREGLETIIDPSLGSDVPFDSVAKVAAIASMCVQREVQHRPFMGEVVQALKLVCNECDEAKEVGSRSSSHDTLSIDLDERVSTGSGRLPNPLQSHYSVPNYNYGIDSERGLPVSELFSSSARFSKEESGSFRRCLSSGPSRTGRGKQFWQRVRRLSAGSVSEHGGAFRLWPGSY
ncbi:receptor-like serine/threonine-protein kinase ALE2 isoform X2 [Pistacia vera]|uniref:receptor-like serine/threonine-protein kinase ALE2 isoform X2 n=1 Tax=Pistacia vera TaxID=55513 RepID=UPI00126365FF|nr:receptor-like serine/threonine-protein kinase ALE2 isoform X2 [Pistacia vera]